MGMVTRVNQSCVYYAVSPKAKGQLKTYLTQYHKNWEIR